MSLQYGNYVPPSQDNEFDRKVRQSFDGKKQASNKAFVEGLTADKLNKIVKTAGMSNQERKAEAISRADCGVFLATHPEFIDTPANREVLKKLLKAWNLYDNATFPDVVRAFKFAVGAKLFQIDEAELARQSDHPLTTFVGPLTNRTYDNFDALLTNERHYALHNMPKASEDELAFENDLSQEEQLTALKAGARIEEHKEEVSNTVKNGQAWMLLRPEYIDNKRNGALIAEQMKEDGVLEGEATVEDHEKAFRKLSSLLSLNKKELTKQHNAELQKRAAEAIAEDGSIFDNSTETEMEDMDLDELRRAANVALARG